LKPETHVWVRERGRYLWGLSVLSRIQAHPSQVWLMIERIYSLPLLTNLTCRGISLLVNIKKRRFSTFLLDSSCFSWLAFVADHRAEIVD
jgi:hypothetical protein